MTVQTDLVLRLEEAAERHETPCGAGDLIWRRWGAGKPVVLCHGGSGSWTHWIRTIPVLQQTCSVWVPDLPGLGDSAMPPPPLTPASSGPVLAEGIRTLFTTEQPHLVGFSFGAHVATLAAAELGHHLTDLTLIGAASLGLPTPHFKFPKERSTMTEAERRAVHRETLSMLMFADPANIDDLAIELQAANIRNARFRSRDFASSDTIKTTLADVPVPLKAIWGERDVIAQPSPERSFEVLRLHHPELVARTIPGAGHWVMYEAADAFNAALIELLELAE